MLKIVLFSKLNFSYELLNELTVYVRKLGRKLLIAPSSPNIYRHRMFMHYSIKVPQAEPAGLVEVFSP
ncbi:MAG: hypothetical protein ACXW0L_05435, partial [Methylosarcina sp.]